MASRKKNKTKPRRKTSSPKAKALAGTSFKLSPAFQSYVQRIKADRSTYLLLVFALSIFMGFGVYHMGKFFITDEIVWLRHRYPMYWNSLMTGDWSQFGNFGATSGILQSILSGHVYFLLNLSDFTSLNFENYLIHWRAPLLIFNLILLIAIFDSTSRLFNRHLALLSVLLMATIPFIIGISQIFNKDTTLWSTACLSILNYLLFLKTHQYKYAIYSGLTLGLALLSKFPATVLFPTYYIFIYLEYLNKDASRDQYLRLLQGYAICMLISLVMVFIFLPACWYNIEYLWEFTWHSPVMVFFWHLIIIAILLLTAEILLLKGAISSRLRDLLPWKAIIYKGAAIFFLANLVIILAFMLTGTFDDSQQFLRRYSGEYRSVQMIRQFWSALRSGNTGLPFLTYIGLLGATGYILFHKRGSQNPRWQTYMIVFILVYLLGSTYAGYSVGKRYQIMLFPFYAMLSAYFYTEIFKKKFISAVCVLMIVGFVELCITSPFYISYSNPLQINNYFKTKVSWGQGGYEIAQVANRLPNAQNLKIFTDYEGACEFFVGTCNRYNYRYALTAEVINQYDYVVLSSSGHNQMKSNIELPDNLMQMYEVPKVSCAAFIGNPKNYVKLVKVQ